MVATFSPIMAGTLRQKIEHLETSLQALGATFSLVGAAAFLFAHLRDGVESTTPLAETEMRAPYAVACSVALACLATQTLTLTPCCSRGPAFAAAMGHVTHDAVCVAQFLTVIEVGVRSLSTSLVALGILVLWLANAAQIHDSGQRDSCGDDLPYPNEVAISFSV